MEGLTFRLADLSKDGSLLFKLDNVCFTRFYDNPSTSDSEIINYLKDCQVYLYFFGDKPVGYFGYKKINNNNTELKVLAVRPEYQRKGLGSMMINHLFDLNKESNFFLATHPKNTQAVIFYLKHGFEIKEWKDNYFGDGQSRIILTKTLINS